MNIALDDNNSGYNTPNNEYDHRNMYTYVMWIPWRRCHVSRILSGFSSELKFRTEVGFDGNPTLPVKISLCATRQLSASTSVVQSHSSLQHRCERKRHINSDKSRVAHLCTSGWRATFAQIGCALAVMPARESRSETENSTWDKWIAWNVKWAPRWELRTALTFGGRHLQQSLAAAAAAAAVISCHEIGAAESS